MSILFLHSFGLYDIAKGLDLMEQHVELLLTYWLLIHLLVLVLRWLW